MVDISSRGKFVMFFLLLQILHLEQCDEFVSKSKMYLQSVDMLFLMNWKIACISRTIITKVAFKNNLEMIRLHMLSKVALVTDLSLTIVALMEPIFILFWHNDLFDWSRWDYIDPPWIRCCSLILFMAIEVLFKSTFIIKSLAAYVTVQFNVFVINFLFFQVL